MADLPDFFISRAGPDSAFAGEIGHILEADGKRVVLQQWDFANRNFMERMHAALTSGARVIALLSNDYLASDHCAAEWQNAIAHDPLNKEGRLIVMRVAECTPRGLLTALAYWDLVPIRGNDELLRDIVRTAVKPGRHKDTSTAPYWRAPRPIVHPEIKPTTSFTGRTDELAAIGSALRAGQAAAVTQPTAVHGLGGIGKSVLAREYAYREQAAYGGVWWLNAARSEEGTAGFEGVERSLVELGAMFIRGLDQVEDRAAAARQTLDFIANAGFAKPWLLIYDNVDDPRVLKDWAPNGNAHVLAATRLGGWPSAVRTIEIEAWPLPEAIAYLLEESGRGDLTAADATEIAEALGRLPLALSHAAALLRARPNITAENYLASLTRRMNEAPKDAEYDRAVFATFQEALGEAESEAKGASAVMSLAAFFAPDAIPEELFSQSAARYPPELAELAGIPGGLDDAIGALAHLSLVDFHQETRSFSAHRLVLAAARDALGDEAPAWSASALSSARAAFPVPEFKTWPLCERLVPHVRAVAAHVNQDSGELAWLIGTLGIYLQERAAIVEVLPLYERARAMSERLAASDPDNTDWQHHLSRWHSRIGNVQSAQGNLSEALSSYQASLAIAERLATSDPGNVGWQRDLSVSHNKIGDVQSAQGNLSEALASYQADLAIAERLALADPGNVGWQRDLSVSHNKIGDVQSAHGNLSEALSSYQASHTIFEGLALADPGNAGWQRDLSVSHNKIGDVQRAQGDLSEALSSYQASLAIAERLAEADPGNAGWQRDLALSYQRVALVVGLQGERERALGLFRDGRAIIIRLRAASPDHAVLVSDLAIFDARIAELEDGASR